MKGGFHMNASRRGSTLLDAVAGVLVFAIGILAVIGTIPYILRSQQATQQYTTAVGLAEKYIGQIKSEASDPAAFNNLNAAYADGDSARNPISGYPGFSSCIQVVNNGAADLKKVTVNIYWTEAKIEKRVTMVNLVRRKNL